MPLELTKQMYSPSTMRFIRKMVTSPSSRGRHFIAVCQVNSSHDMNKNFDVCRGFIERAKSRNVEMVFFPEDFHCLTTDKDTVDRAVSEDGPYLARFRNLARKHQIWLSLGGFYNKVNHQALPSNTHIIIDSEGNTKGVYDKLHLFDLDIPGKVRCMESDVAQKGLQLVPPVPTPVGRLGLSMCYDLRFPELALWYRYQGAQVLTYPSNFPIRSGLAHWEALLKARAIETQCYVVAAAQTGNHTRERSSYGHSMVVDPWGAVIAQCSDGVGMCFAEIDLDYVARIREKLPVLEHRRPDLYQLNFNHKERDYIEVMDNLKRQTHG